jgi:hypothetical protein
MNAEVKDYLALFAEVAIATAALSGIIMVLAVSGRKLSTDRVAQIATQLRMALIVTVFALLPLLLANVEITASWNWRICSGLYILTILYVGISSARGRRTYGQALAAKGRAGGAVVGVSALALLPLNIWLAVPWPYLLQLMLALLMSIFLFLDFIVQILAENSDDG